jgi:hypothetical protein
VLYVCPNATVVDLKRAVADKEGIAVHLQRLSVSSTELHDSLTLPASVRDGVPVIKFSHGSKLVLL